MKYIKFIAWALLAEGSLFFALCLPGILMGHTFDYYSGWSVAMLAGIHAVAAFFFCLYKMAGVWLRS